MKIIDMHIHLGFAGDVKHTDILESMEKAGVYGGCVFSAPPKQYDNLLGKDFKERLEDVLSFTKEHKNRLFPILWIHSDEENILENIETAVNCGIDGFKMICNNFYVYEEKSLAILRKIARLNKPVFFHTGILWDGKASSKYNRPLNWEKLIDIKNLRFSMGHCSWPWHDECISLYGKFLNALNERDDIAEMFFDLTPGTPTIYRKELLTKLFNVGYDVSNNIMFGTDCNGEAYNGKWCSSWLETDRKIMDELGVSLKNRENLYFNNLMRFLGKTERETKVLSPQPDDADTWSSYNEKVPEIIEKWYKKLGFSEQYDREFYTSLRTIQISDAVSLEHYDEYCEDGKRNLLTFLLLCEDLEKQYQQKGISAEIFLDTIYDVVRWTDAWSIVKGELFLGELMWLKRHFAMKLFKLGRLEFCMGNCEFDVPEKNLKKGDNVIEVHIPSGEPLSVDACVKSIEMAKEFFEKYYPEFAYSYFTCHSWLLDEKLKEILKPTSNILAFSELFEIVNKEPSDSLLKYIFKNDTTRANVATLDTGSHMATEVKKRILNGETFYEGFGLIKK